MKIFQTAILEKLLNYILYIDVNSNSFWVKILIFSPIMNTDFSIIKNYRNPRFRIINYIKMEYIEN